MGQVSNWVELIRWIFASVLWRRWRKKGSLVGRRRLVMPGMDQPLNSEKDIPLREDIRLLGRILGDTVRSQEGDAVFDIIEGIRRSSIRFRRDEDQVARRELEAALNRLSRDETIQIIRAFSYSHLANTAEDQHHIRRTRAQGAPYAKQTRSQLLS
jgi:phosphoenolpyruvate carboxylase